MPTTGLPSAPALLHRPYGTGATYWGPGDLYRFLVTGEETGGAYFAMEALVPPGGGPPPHIHRNEDETFYVVEGSCDIRLGDKIVSAAAGDFVNVPRGEVHNFHNSGDSPMRMILTSRPQASSTSSKRHSSGRSTRPQLRPTTSTRWPRATPRPRRATGWSS
jgi:mannose-6-phosphate isomerase-like protein (cupin superfamily)